MRAVDNQLADPGNKFVAAAAHRRAELEVGRH
jgi:hypothetical protein